MICSVIRPQISTLSTSRIAHMRLQKRTISNSLAMRFGTAPVVAAAIGLLLAQIVNQHFAPILISNSNLQCRCHHQSVWWRREDGVERALAALLPLKTGVRTQERQPFSQFSLATMRHRNQPSAADLDFRLGPVPHLTTPNQPIFTSSTRYQYNCTSTTAEVPPVVVPVLVLVFVSIIAVLVLVLGA
jgi:hypothetical protein